MSKSAAELFAKEKQKELNKKLGEKMAECCDIAIVVGLYNRDAITEGLHEKDFQGKLYEVDSFNKAQEVLQTLLKPGTTVLYENDLPDSFK